MSATGALGAILVVLGYLSLLPAVAWWVGHNYLGDSRWWMFVLNSVAPYLFLPVPVVMLAGLRWRRWGLLTASLVPAAVFVALFGPALLPRQAKVEPVPDGTPTLTVMTFNVHARNPNPEAVARAILASDADVVALQELAVPMALELRRLLADAYPHDDLVLEGGWQGLGVFSRVPLTPLPRPVDGLGVRNPQLTRLHLPWGEALLVNVHNLSIPRTLPDWPSEITYSTRQRERVAQGLFELATNRDRPLVAAGDFNSTPRSAAYATVTAALRDAWLEAGFGFGQTFPGGPLKPTPFGVPVPDWLLRIDYVFHSEEWRALDARIGPWDGESDHRPVLVRLAYLGPGA
ncbi:MAG TPA: endonuclease/exonuclease/phosphatase family protein [Trueperaceae bacterium]|nr:endonuclease/exonuclease/phosphatase family protein [Trueperaceae bacterium]